MAVRGGRDTSGGGDCGSEAGVSTRRRGAPPSAAFPGRLLLRPVGHRRRQPIQPRRVCLRWVVAEPRRAARGDLNGRRPVQWRPVLLLGFSPLPSGVRWPWLRVEGRRLARLRPQPSGVGQKHTLFLLTMGLDQWA